jgi:hypothetical protein
MQVILHDLIELWRHPIIRKSGKGDHGFAGLFAVRPDNPICFPYITSGRKSIEAEEFRMVQCNGLFELLAGCIGEYVRHTLKLSRLWRDKLKLIQIT